MVSYNKMLNGESYGTPVLILIVGEDGLVHNYDNSLDIKFNVLIFIVGEDGLVHNYDNSLDIKFNVLILIVGEDGLVLN